MWFTLPHLYIKETCPSSQILAVVRSLFEVVEVLEWASGLSL